MTEEEVARRKHLFGVCSSKEELSDWIFCYLGLRMPDCTVDQDSNCNPMEMIWFTYQKCLENDENFSQVLFYAGRDSFKTLSASIIEVLAMFHLGRSVAHLAAVLTQSTKAQQYMKKFLRRPHLSDFLVGDAQRSTRVVWHQNFKTGDILTRKEYLALGNGQQIDYVPSSTVLTEYEEYEEYVNVLVATLQGVNSEHVLLLITDEVEVIKNAAVMDEAKNIPAPKDGKMPVTVMTSTRKFKFGFVQAEINAASRTGTVVKHWNVIDVTQACPSSRHRPDLPRLPIYRSTDHLNAVGEEAYRAMPIAARETYVKDEGYHGCLANCKLFFACKGRLATEQTSTSKLLRPIATVQNKFRNYATNPGMAKAQMLCLEPDSIGLIYPRFGVQTHVLSPAQAYEKIFGSPPSDQDVGSDDGIMKKSRLIELVMRDVEVRWGAGVDFGSTHAFAWIQGFVFGSIAFVTGALAIPNLDPDESVRAVAHFMEQDPACYPDMAGPQMIKVLRKAGFSMREWKKGPGSVAAGIGVLQGKIAPPFGDDPEFYIIHDSLEDPSIDVLVGLIQEYHWKLDIANQPTGEPDDKDDDLLDALRYWIMNACPTRGSTVSTEVVSEQVNAPPQGARYDEKNWVKQAISEATGKSWEGPASWGESFKNPDGTPFFGEQKKAPRQQRGRLIVDVD